MAENVKQERGVHSSRSYVSPVGTLTAASQSGRRRPHDDVRTEMLDQRDARSLAPSFETRQPKANRTVAGSSTNGEDDRVILMQVRNLPESPRTQQSFIASSYGFQSIGAKHKQINDALGKLQTLGIQQVVSLPELVLVGDQSAGKSSLMSALAGLSLPQSQGTCTRCPYHIRLSRSSEWCCRVSLHIDYVYQPVSGRADRRATEARPFPPWAKGQGREHKHFKTIRDPQESIEDVLKWAQVAILNPTTSHEVYVRASENPHSIDPLSHSCEAKFSPNTIALEITGPHLPDLSFYDLPGVFSTLPRAEDDYLADVVKNLTRHYIKRENAIVLWAVPMNGEPENSQSFRLIRSVKDASKRVVGVMTKADLLQKGNNARWVQMLRGEAHQTGYGYFVTSRCDKSDLADQDAYEESFFNRVVSHNGAEPDWSRDFEEFDHLCGVPSLKKFLERKLSEEFGERLPDVRNDINNGLSRVVAKLGDLPELPKNPEFEVRSGLKDFAQMAKMALNDRGFAEKWADMADAFKNQILTMKPRYVVKDNKYPVDASGAIIIDCDSPSGSPAPQAVPRPKRGVDSLDHLATPSKRLRGADVKLEDVGQPFAVSFSGVPGGTPSAAGTPSKAKLPPYTLQEIRNKIRSHQRHGVPYESPFEVKENLCLEAVGRWDEPMFTFLRDVMNLLSRQISKALFEALGGMRQRFVYKEARNHLTSFLREHYAALTKELRTVYQLERRQLYTANEVFFKKNSEDELIELYRHRLHYQFAAEDKKKQTQSTSRPRQWESFSEEERSQERKRVQTEMSKRRDEYELEMSVCAYVRGYYLTAAYRFMDNVFLHLKSGLFVDIVDNINGYIDKKLGIQDCSDKEMFDRLMEEDETTAVERNRLKADKEKFTEALATLDEIDASTGGHGATQSNGTDDCELMEIEMVGVDMPTPSSSESDGPVRRVERQIFAGSRETVV